MKKIDKVRKTYHNFYCENKWETPEDTTCASAQPAWIWIKLRKLSLHMWMQRLNEAIDIRKIIV